MKTQEEIEQLADDYATSIYGYSNLNHNAYLDCKRHCIEFYTQCQKDMTDKKYNLDNFKKSIKITNNKLKYIEDYINLLNKQD